MSKFTTFTESTAEDRDIFELQSESAKLLGSMKHTLKVIDTDTLKVNITRKYFAKTNTELLSSVYQVLGKMDPLQVKKGMTQLKGVERDTKTLKKILKNKNEICNIIHVIESLLSGEKNLDTSPLFAYKFGEDVSTKYIDKYYNALRLAQSRDKRKQQRGARHLEGVILDQRTQIQKLDKEIELLTEATDITKIPEAVVIQKSIKTFYEGFFDVEYAAQIISNEILDITREIFRDQVTENK